MGDQSARARREIDLSADLVDSGLAVNRNGALDGLRGFAAATVVISHFSNRTQVLGGLLGRGTGEIGVMLFFVLSGFLMGQLYLDTTPNGAAILAFYRRRVARVVPLYLIVVGVSYFARESGWGLPPVEPDNVWNHLLFWQGIGLLWTLPVEVQFYLVFPLIWLTFARNSSATILGLLLLMAVVDLLGFPTIPPLLGYISFFLAGILASRFRWQSTRGASLLFLCSIVVYVLMLPPMRDAHGLHTWLGGAAPPTLIWQSWLYLLTTTLIILTGAVAPVAQLVFGSPPLRYLGMVSYSLYLLHPPVMRAVRRVDALDGSPAALAVVLVPTLLLVASLSYFLIEAPLRRLINRADRSARVA